MKNKNKIPPVRALSMGYAITILAGTILLLLPISTRSGETTKFIDALFAMAAAYKKLANYHKALEYIEKLLQIEPDAVVAKALKKLILQKYIL